MTRRWLVVLAGTLVLSACAAADARELPTTDAPAATAEPPSPILLPPATEPPTTVRVTTTTSRPAEATTTSETRGTTTAPRPTTLPRPSSTTTSSTTSTSTTSTTTTTTTTSTTTVPSGAPGATSPAPVPGPPPVEIIPLDIDRGSAPFEALTAAAQFVAPGNLALSVSVWRDGGKAFGASTGLGATGVPVTTESPFVVASVSKLVTALTIARLAQAGLLEIEAPVPWEAMGVPHDPGWADVTVRELLWHTSGMPVRENAWLNQPGSCAVPLIEIVAAPPTETRGRWRYSNGNYCVLGLLIESVTLQRFDDAARSWLLDPLGITGPHLTVTGLQPGDGPYALDVRRLDRLGGAGAWMASTDDVATLLASVTAGDRALLTWPGIMLDQYGWGHTGTVDGAKACAWVMEDGRTVLTAFVAGNRPSSGSKLCDVLVPALADDLGIGSGPPVRVHPV